jgi:hypothetical protein
VKARSDSGSAGEGGKRTARDAADRERARLARTDASLEKWQNAETGVPVLVHTMAGAPSYWLVPIELREGDTATLRLVGFVRVTPDGRVAAAGRYQGEVRTVTGITADEARRMAAAESPTDAVTGEPLFVHDGPPGREGWRVDVTHADRSVRTLLVTRGGVTRPTGGGEPD